MWSLPIIGQSVSNRLRRMTFQRSTVETMKMSEMTASNDVTQKCLAGISTWKIVLLVIADLEMLQSLS
jgi:hypothetical protein